LHPQPDTGAISERLAETYGNVRRHWLLFCHEIVKVLSGDAKGFGHLHLRHPETLHDLRKQSSGVRRAAVGIPVCYILSHIQLRSVILLEIDKHRIFALESESDAPRTVYVDGVARRIKSLEDMEVEAGEIHLVGLDANV
jgi:hypothetical protein